MMIIRYFWLGGDYQISAEFLVYNNDVLWKKVNAFSFPMINALDYYKSDLDPK